MKKIIVAAIVALIVIGGGVGGYFAYDHHRDKVEAQEAKAAAAKRVESMRKDCEDTFEPLQSSLEGIGSRLKVGLSYSEFGDQLGDVQVAYDQVDWHGLIEGDDPNTYCLENVGVHLEKAMNTYAESYKTWGDCIKNYGGCNVDRDANPKMQKNWLEAGLLVDSAQDGLNDFDPPPAPLPDDPK